ncbi:MAG: hypothetical protein OEY15_03940 [Myxococcales bacterium]|nr:hypothetical protein [Myxococcales bacterium]
MTGEIFDLDAWRQILVHSMTELAATIVSFLPSLLGMLMLLVVGFVISRLVAFAASQGLARLGLDRAVDRIGFAETLQRAGVQSPFSRLIARLLFWVLMLTFVLSAVETLGLTAVTQTIDRLIVFLPNVVGAGLILVLGLLFARFVRNLVGSGAAAANVPEAQRLGAAAGVITSLVVMVLALEHLGVETALLTTTLTAVIAGFSVTLGVAFALGAYPIVTHILAGHYLRKSLPAETVVEVRGRHGVLDRVGPTETLFRDGERTWSIPNAQLLEEVVAH